MSYRARIQERRKLGNGKTLVTSQSVGSYYFYEIVKFCFKGLFWLFYWTIMGIPIVIVKLIKLIANRKNKWFILLLDYLN